LISHRDHPKKEKKDFQKNVKKNAEKENHTHKGLQVKFLLLCQCQSMILASKKKNKKKQKNERRRIGT